MVRVTSEIGRLRKVLVHEPGPEVDRMVPPMMEELLFDDILFGDRARDEHRRFRRLLQLLGIEVVEANQLLTEALAAAYGVEATFVWQPTPTYRYDLRHHLFKGDFGHHQSSGHGYPRMAEFVRDQPLGP